jgi:N,N'-diacetyllegionaminate synthase
MKIIEIGHNHMGSLEEGEKLVNNICQTSCDAVSVQFREDLFYEENLNFTMPLDFYERSSKKIKKSNKKFGVAISNIEMIDFFNKLNPSFYKLLSKDLEDHNFLESASKKIEGKVYLSTGMSSYKKIEEALEILGPEVTLIHTSMSDDLADVNLKAIQSMKESFNVEVAYGNHCKNLNAIYAALSFNPNDIFLYAKNSKKLNYPDNHHAIQTDHLENFLKSICEIEKTIGDGIKHKITKGIKGQK